ncbi:MAG TPA: 30S ribosomal protein S7 [Bacillota bacterium]|nr:30S ribosomal protein S7 [Bacillota bacterium]HOH10174.1 30S ribosomal protein S7 [Bacillota bacterium]HOS50240.1 30S ribosomal protein S7 [Bacillota bacterium]HOY88924.1 30S ribosomal protein S7 [Bacillota bacterium]HPI01736.1 30S ribosomal protein S7 [Bacillota bacterium]
MPRKGHVPNREVTPDPVYNSALVSEFINKIVMEGKKSVAEKIFYGSCDIIQKKTGSDPLEVLDKAMKNVMPLLEVKPRRVGGATYQVPMEVRPERRKALALRWIITNSRKRGERTMMERFASEIMDASNNLGASIKKREDMHKMAEANKAFAHYRW